MKRGRPQCIAYLTQYVSSSEAKRHTLTPQCAVHRINLAVGMEYAISLLMHEPGKESGLDLVRYPHPDGAAGVAR